MKDKLTRSNLTVGFRITSYLPLNFPVEAAGPEPGSVPRRELLSAGQLELSERGNGRNFLAAAIHKGWD